MQYCREWVMHARVMQIFPFRFFIPNLFFMKIYGMLTEYSLYTLSLYRVLFGGAGLKCCLSTPKLIPHMSPNKKKCRKASTYTAISITQL